MVYAAQGEGDKERSGSVAPNISEALKLPRGVSIESNPPRTNNAFVFQWGLLGLLVLLFRWFGN